MKMRLPLLAFAIATARTASGADAFTINVPVEFKNLNAAVTAVRIRCVLTGRDPVTLVPRIFGPGWGRKSVDLPVAGGAYKGRSPVTLVFKTEDFTALEQAALGNVTAGGCDFSILTDGSMEYVPYGGESGPILAQMPKAPFKHELHFTVP
jgi:hypothetical protein